MERRSLLVTLGSAFGGGVVGYAAGAAEPTESATSRESIRAVDETSTETSTPTETPAPTETPTPTPTETPTPTPTATPEPRYPVYEFDEAFTVGGPSTEFRYVVHRAFWADSVGRFGGVPAEGVYVGAVVTAENRGQGRTPVPLQNVVLRGGVRKYPTTEAANAAEYDDRLEGRSLANVSLYPDNPVRGVVVYDLAPGNAGDLALHFTPPDVDAPLPHVVRFGPLDGLDPL